MNSLARIGGSLSKASIRQPSLRNTTRTSIRRSSREKSREVHEELSDVLGKPSPDGPRGIMAQIKADPGRKARYQQALFNSLVSFVMLMMAAQALKSAKQRQKAEDEVRRLEKDNAARKAKLQALIGKEACISLAQEIVDSDTQPQGFFSKPPSPASRVDSIAQIIQQRMLAIVGDSVTDEAERAELQLAALSSSSATSSREDSDAQLRELQALGAEFEKDQEGGTVIKKRVFTM